MAFVIKVNLNKLSEAELNQLSCLIRKVKRSKFDTPTLSEKLSAKLRSQGGRTDYGDNGDCEHDPTLTEEQLDRELDEILLTMKKEHLGKF